MVRASCARHYEGKFIAQDNDMLERTLRPLPDARLLEEGLILRHPVVAVLGHVDRGRTTIVDALRGTNTAEREAGGIMQPIGAYRMYFFALGRE